MMAKEITMAQILKEAQRCLETEAQHRRNIIRQRSNEKTLNKQTKNSKEPKDLIYPEQEERLIF